MEYRDNVEQEFYLRVTSTWFFCSLIFSFQSTSNNKLENDQDKTYVNIQVRTWITYQDNQIILANEKSDHWGYR